MSIRLKVVEADGTTELFEFSRSVVSIGRAPQNSISLEDEALSCRVGEFRQDEVGGVVFVCSERDGSICHQREAAVTSSQEVGEWDVAAGDRILAGSITIVVESLSTSQGIGISWLDMPHLDRKIGAEERTLLEVLSRVAQDANVGAILRAAAAMLELHSDLTAERITLTLIPESTDFYARDAFALSPSKVGEVRRCGDPVQRLGAVGLRFHSELTTERYALIQHEGAVELLMPIGLGGTPAAVLGFEFLEAESSQIVQAALVSRELEAVASIALQHLRLKAKAESLDAENAYFRERQRRHYLFKELVCESAAMRDAYRGLSDRVDIDTPVLIVGEAGSGKELLARAVHHLGKRKEEMMISLNCGSLTGPEVDIELFGSISNGLTGASTPRKGVFELARGGTVYLEEVDLLSPLVQGKILRMLTEGEIRRVGDSAGRQVTSRLVCSVHRDLESLVASGKLRRDLFLTLKDHAIMAPALRDRREDLMPLARLFMRKFAMRYSKRCRRIHEELEQVLLAYQWPGNARELQSRIESAVLRCEGEELKGEHFSLPD